jgi:hypothetical protein
MRVSRSVRNEAQRTPRIFESSTLVASPLLRVRRGKLLCHVDSATNRKNTNGFQE